MSSLIMEEHSLASREPPEYPRGGGRGGGGWGCRTRLLPEGTPGMESHRACLPLPTPRSPLSLSLSHPSFPLPLTPQAAGPLCEPPAVPRCL